MDLLIQTLDQNEEKLIQPQVYIGMFFNICNSTIYFNVYKQSMK